MIKRIPARLKCVTPSKEQITKVKGTLAIANHLYPNMYGHFVFDVLGSLALIEMNGIPYDYLCAPYDKKFMKELLSLWGVPQRRIIAKKSGNQIVADSVILPTCISRDQHCVRLVNFYPPETLWYTREKLLSNIPDLEQLTQSLPKKIFISRADAQYRRIPNEDEIYAVFAQRGYVRFCLSQLSVKEQIALFYNATHIIGPSGSNMTNMIFAQPNTNYLEFMTAMPDATFYILSQIFHLNYHCRYNLTWSDFIVAHAESVGKSLSLDVVHEFLQQHPEF